ncbi:MAG: SufD family Fe-S cluster assembly protein [Candidatus Izimaplasma sp.]|nr:SufD family Fe-S cluster assembly protein [Candidatus Izimaplasma bacterium]
MIKSQETELSHLNIPSEIIPLFTDKLTNYLIIKDGVIITSNLAADFEKLTINNLDGLLIDVPKNFSQKETIHFFYIQEKLDFESKTMIILNESSELHYFEYLINTSKTNINYNSTVIIKENAKLIYSGMSNFNEEADVQINRNCYISRYGTTLYSVAEVNDANASINTKIYLEGSYASATIKTVAITSNNQKVKIKQIIEHKAPETEGYIENYGVANNLSSLAFEGTGKINKNMKRSIARQQNRGIVLGEKSRLDANPLLFIDEYDVEASHGAAIGKIDEEQLYYLMSRGLTLKDSERLIISGFLSPIIKLLSTEELVKDFVKTVKRKTL